MSAELFKKMAQSIIDGDSDISVELARESISQNIDPIQAITDGFVIGVNTVGDAFAAGDAFLPELVMAGEAMKAAVATLEPEMEKRGTQRKMLGKVVLATVEGDIHEIGKSLVGTMLTASGFEVIDLGVDVKSTKLVEKVKEVDADILAMSALLTTTMSNMEKITQEIKKAKPETLVAIGGAPVNEDFQKKIGADVYTPDPQGLVEFLNLKTA